MTFDDLCNESHQEPVVALFYGAACAPCERLKPKLRTLCAEKGVRLEEFNSAGEMAWIRKLGLRSVPAVIVIASVPAVPVVAFVGDAPDMQLKLRSAGVERM